MAISARQRIKHMRAAQALLPDAHITGYAVGRSGANPVSVVAAMLGSAALISVVLFVLTGTLVIPGILLMLVVQHFVSPPRGLLVAGQGVALTRRSIWTGRPHDVVATMGHAYVRPVEVSLGRVKVLVGGEPVWLSSGEEAALRAAFPSTVSHG